MNQGNEWDICKRRKEQKNQTDAVERQKEEFITSCSGIPFFWFKARPDFNCPDHSSAETVALVCYSFHISVKYLRCIHVCYLYLLLNPSTYVSQLGSNLPVNSNIWAFFCFVACFLSWLRSSSIISLSPYHWLWTPGSVCEIVETEANGKQPQRNIPFFDVAQPCRDQRHLALVICSWRITWIHLAVSALGTL